MPGIPGPAVTTSPTGTPLAQGPAGAPGPTGPQGPPGQGVVPWARYNFTGSGGAYASGAQLPTSATDIQVLVDASGGATAVGMPATMADGQPLLLKDPNGSWATNTPLLNPIAGWQIENPANPGTYSSSPMPLWPQKGASISFVADAVQKIMLLA